MPLRPVSMFGFIALLACAVAAGAQPPPGVAPARPRTPIGFISLNGGYQVSTSEFDDSFTFTAHQETGTSRITYPIDTGPAFEVGGGVRLWRGLGVGVAVSRFTIDGPVNAASSVPHPFFLQQLRQISGEADGIRREETTVHVQAQYSIPIGPKLHITLMGGPSVLQVSQALVMDVNYSEEYPFDVATFAGVDSARKKSTNTGFNAGGDVRWMFTPSVGLGAMVRFTRADVALDAVDDRTVSLDAGGAQVGVGVRLAF